VVWAKPSEQNDARWQNVGALQVDSERRGRLDTLTAIKQPTIAITPEKSAAAAQPSGPVVMRAQVLR
jgi:hypothetical protein